MVCGLEQAAKIRRAGDSVTEHAINSCIDSYSYVADGKSDDEARKKCMESNTVSAQIQQMNQNAAADGRVSPTLQNGIAALKALSFNTDWTDDDKTIAMNFTGTYVRKMEDSNSFVVEWHPHRLSLRDLMYGGTGAEVIIPDGEEDMKKETMDIEGFKPTVENKLNAIIPKIQSNFALTDDEKDFVNASHVPITKLAEITTGSPGMRNVVFDIMSDLIVADMAMTTVKKYISCVEMNIGKQRVVDPELMLARIDAVKRDLDGEMRRLLDAFESSARSYELTAFCEKQIKSVSGRQLTHGTRARR